MQTPMVVDGSVDHYVRTDGAVRLLQVQIWLLFLVPATLRFTVLGGIGSPAVLFGIGLFFVWAAASLASSISVGRPCKPVRISLALFWSVTLTSFALLHRSSVVSDEASNADRYLIFLLSFSGIALFAAEAIRGRQGQLQIMRTTVTAVAAMCAVALLQSRAGIDLTMYLERLPGISTYGQRSAILARSGFARPAGTAAHPIEFGVVTGLGLALALHLALYDRAWGRPRRVATFGLIALGIPIAVSRSALLVAVVVLVVFLIDADRATRLRSLIVIGFFLVTVFLFVPGLLGTLRGYVFAGQNDSSVSTRTSDYAAVAHYLREAPWLGRGAGTFLPRLRILDNQYLMTLIETGLIGVLVFLLLFSLPIWLGSASRTRFTEVSDRQLSRVFVAVGAAILVASATFDSVSFPMFTLFSALLIGLCGQHWMRSLDARPGSTNVEGGPRR